MAIILVAMVDMENGIGDDNGNVLFSLSKNTKRFNEITANKNVVMGRKTWDSLIVKPIPKRKNHVLTTVEDFKVKGRTKVVHSIEEILEMGKKGDVYVIGGGELYLQLMPYADKMYLTHVHFPHGNAHVYFPEVSPQEWKMHKMEKQEKDKKHPVSFTFTEYHRKTVTEK